MFKSTVLLAVFAGLFSAQGALAAGHVIEHAGDKPSLSVRQKSSRAKFVKIPLPAPINTATTASRSSLSNREPAHSGIRIRQDSVC